MPLNHTKRAGEELQNEMQVCYVTSNGYP